MEKKMPVFKKQTTKEKVLTILYFFTIILFVVAYGLNVSKVLKGDYWWLFALSIYLIVQYFRLKEYNPKWSKRCFTLTIVGIILGLIELLFL